MANLKIKNELILFVYYTLFFISIFNKKVLYIFFIFKIFLIILQINSNITFET